MKIRSILFVLLIGAPLLASASGHPVYEFKPDLGNQASLQRGAADFMNYCSGCHSLKYVRYNRLAKDLGIPEKLVQANLMFTTDKIGNTIETSLPAADGAAWFGRAPPDLTLAARARGASWVYSYLLSFYVDPSRPTGVNNLMLPNASMPHVLGGLQGYQKLAETAGEHAAEEHSEAGPKFEMVQPGSLKEEEYRGMVGDLTNFLVYTAEPAKLVRYSLGFKVILFLILFTFLAWLLYQEYWKDVH